MADERALWVWRKYEQLKNQSKIIRAGFGLTGIYPYNVENPRELQRSESVLEHVMGAMNLLTLISVYYPEAIPQTELLPCLLLLMHHEVGEGEIGDLPDDGNRDEAAKNRAELEAMKAYCITLPKDFGRDLLIDFMELQSRMLRRAQWVYLADKLEAVLQGLIYERDGRGGSFDMKAMITKVSDQDQHYIQRTGSIKLVDNWAAHFMDHARDMECAAVFLEVLRAAVEDVREEWFSWLTE